MTITVLQDHRELEVRRLGPPAGCYLELTASPS